MERPRDEKDGKPVNNSQPANHEVAGYMPGRGEWDWDPHEVPNEVDEHCVKDLAFTEYDSPEDRGTRVL